MDIKELKERYMFYVRVAKDQIERKKYEKGFSYKPGSLEDSLAESEAVLELIEKSEK